MACSKCLPCGWLWTLILCLLCNFVLCPFRVLDLAGCYFLGTPLESGVFKKMGCLEYLDIGRNNFDDTIPSEHGLPESLRSVTVGHGSLQLLHAGHNAKLTSDPAVKREPPYVCCSTCRYLNLHGSSYTGTIPVSLTSLSSLTGLDISKNRLTSTIPARLLQELRNLTCVLRGTNGAHLQVQVDILSLPLLTCSATHCCLRSFWQIP